MLQIIKYRNWLQCFLILTLFGNCQHEIYFDTTHSEPNLNDSAVFILQGSPGTCINAVVSGEYIRGVTLAATHTVAILVSVTKPGPWAIATTPVSGISFSGYGVFTQTGVQTVQLTGSGSPVDTGQYQIPVTAGASQCLITLTARAQAALPCILPENVVDLDGVGTLGFTSGVHGTPVGATFVFSGIAANGDLTMIFGGSEYPAPGAYKVRGTTSVSNGDVYVKVTLQGLSWTPTGGMVHVVIDNGKMTAAFCGLEFIAIDGLLTRQSYGSAYVTDK